jgi:proline iminopeptidase
MINDEFTISELMLDAGDGHKLYVQDWGSPEAKTSIIFLHGGPGSSCNDGHKKYFNPKTQRVVFFDQRGSGKSLPYGSLKNNTTEDLIEDISKIADKLGIKTFNFVGGSWGTCLALAYGLKFPERVKAMVLRGIFTGSQAEIDFLDKGGFRNFFPEVWEAFVERAPANYKDNPAAYHQPRVLGSNAHAAKESAFAYSEMESALIRLDDRHTAQNLEIFDPAGTIIEVHYMANRCFMPDNYIFDNASKLTMPIWIIQGRYDMVCLPKFAHDLHKKLPNSHLQWTMAGHSGNDRENWLATRTILEQL